MRNVGKYLSKITAPPALVCCEWGRGEKGTRAAKFVLMEEATHTDEGDDFEGCAFVSV